MLNVTVHDKTNHTVHKTIAVLIAATVTKNGLRTAVENLKSLTRIVMDPPTPPPPPPRRYRQKYIQIVHTIVCIVCINVNRLNGTRTRAAVNVLMKRKDTTRVYKASWHTKSKKEVAGNFFARSCHQQQPIATVPYHECST